MMKLSDQFSAVRANVLMMQPLPNISQAYRLFAQEERHKEMAAITNQTESLAFLADKKDSTHIPDKLVLGHLLTISVLGPDFKLAVLM